MNRTPLPPDSAAATFVKASSAALLAMYAANCGGQCLRTHRPDVHDVTVAALAHSGQEAQCQVHGSEVVERHHPLEVVQTVVGAVDRPADRMPGAVDEHVDVAVLGEDRRRASASIAAVSDRSAG